MRGDREEGNGVKRNTRHRIGDSHFSRAFKYRVHGGEFGAVAGDWVICRAFRLVPAQGRSYPRQFTLLE
jgi:hypothetical protein